MSNPFYTKTGNPQAQTRGLSSQIRNEFTLIEQGFDGVAPKNSPAFTGTPTAPTPSGSNTGQVANVQYVINAALSGQIPGQTGNAGKFLKTDGSNASWDSPVTTASTAEAEAGADNTKMMTPLRTAEAIAKQAWGTGDIVLTARELSSPSWLPADGSTYNQSAYPALFAQTGLIPNENAGVSSGYSSAGTFASNASNAGKQKIATNGSGVWIATGALTYGIGRSTDLSTWTTPTVHNATGVNCSNVAYGNGRFVVTTDQTATNKVYVSTDNGLTWTGNTASGLTTPQQFYWLEWLPTANLFVGQYFTGTQFRMATSPDGSTWTDRGVFPVATGAATKATYVASDGYLYIGVGSGEIGRTNDGINWALVQSTNVGKVVNAIFQIGSYLVAVGDSGYCYRSSNGATWSSFTSPAGSGSLNTGASANGMAVVSVGVGANNSYVSYDGLTWTLVTVSVGTYTALRRAQGISNQIVFMCDDVSSNVYLTKHSGFSYNTATQFITPWKNFSNTAANYLNAYIKT